MPPLFVAIYVTLVGAIIGSFLNVVIHRYPRGESVVFPASRCPHCRERIQWFDNIPVLSFLFLLGRCRRCKSPISIRYPLVEAANALFYLAIYLGIGVSILSALVAIIVSMTIALIASIRRVESRRNAGSPWTEIALMSLSARRSDGNASGEGISVFSMSTGIVGLLCFNASASSRNT